MLTKTFNRDKAEAFAGQMLGILNAGALSLMTSIGHRTNLFDSMAGLPPSTSDEIATAAGLKERYVREWLGAMVTGRIVEYDPEKQTYFLPPEHAACLTRVAGADNIALFTQYMSLMGLVEDRIVDCFYKGGGVPYSAYPKFQKLMSEESDHTVAAALVASILPLAEDIPEALNRGIKVLDVGCGSGHALMTMAKAFPNSKFTGYDFSEEGIAAARSEAERLQLRNLTFEVKDAAKIDDRDEYGLITTFDAIHDQAHPTLVLRAISQALKADGTYLMQDIRASSYVEKNMDHPVAPMLYTASTMHCMTVSLAYDGEGLGTMWGEEKALEMLKQAGFSNVLIKQLPHDIQNNYYIAKKN